MEQKPALERKSCSTAACARLVNCPHKHAAALPARVWLPGPHDEPPTLSRVSENDRISMDQKPALERKSCSTAACARLVNCPHKHAAAFPARVWLPGPHNEPPTLLRVSENDRISMEQKPALERKSCSTAACARLVNCPHKHAAALPARVWLPGPHDEPPTLLRVSENDRISMDQKPALERKSCSTAACARLVNCPHKHAAALPARVWLPGPHDEPPTLLRVSENDRISMDQKPALERKSCSTAACARLVNCPHKHAAALPARVWLPGPHDEPPTLLRVSENDRISMDQKPALERKSCSTAACARLVNCPHKHAAALPARVWLPGPHDEPPTLLRVSENDRISKDQKPALERKSCSTAACARLVNCPHKHAAALPARVWLLGPHDEPPTLLRVSENDRISMEQKPALERKSCSTAACARLVNCPHKHAAALPARVWLPGPHDEPPTLLRVSENDRISMDQKPALERKSCSTAACARLVNCPHKHAAALPARVWLPGPHDEPPTLLRVSENDRISMDQKPALERKCCSTAACARLVNCPHKHATALPARVWLPGPHDGPPTLSRVSENDRISKVLQLEHCHIHNLT